LTPRHSSIISRLENCLRSHDHVPIAAIARSCDVSRRFLTYVLSGERRLPDPLGERLDGILTPWEAGELTFRRVGQIWEAEYHTPPNPLPPPQARMVRATDFVEWARCTVCGHPRYSLVTLHGAAAHWYLCNGCMPWETAGVGAQLVKRKRK
jgi:hypothetical protein